MYSAVFFGWPVTTISPNRDTSTPTCSIDVASATSTGARPCKSRSTQRAATACGCRRALWASASSAVMARRRTDVSRSGVNSVSSREEIREVSSSIVSIPAVDVIRSDRPRLRPCERTRVVTSSSR